MRMPSEERYTIISTISRVEAKKVLNAKCEQGWKLVGFTTREAELVMVFDRRLKWVVKLKRLLKGLRRPEGKNDN